MKAEGANKLTPGQDRAIVALLSERTVAKAAAVAKVGERTLHTWLANPTFRKEYHRARRASFDQAVGMAQKYGGLAVHTLASVMADENSPASAKVSAASTILKFGHETLLLDDLAARIEAIEEGPGTDW